MDTMCCKHCDRAHEELEPAFGKPDAVFAVPAEERESRVRASEDFASIDDRVFFIRAVAPLPVRGRDVPYCWGFWVKVSKAHYDEYARYFSFDPPLDHPGFQGTLANQSRYLPPTLGLPVHVHIGRGKERPRLMLLDDTHTLAQQQARGLTEAEVHEWSTRLEPVDAMNTLPLDPPAPYFTPSLDGEGWVVLAPAQVGKVVHELDAPPAPGDLVKVAFRFLAANAEGEVTTRVEFMWVLLDDVADADGWSGTLNNHPFVPGPIDCGSRVWVRPEHVIEFWRGNESAASAPGASKGVRARLARVAQWLRAAAWRRASRVLHRWRSQ